jgi:hypothetical protein
MRHVVRCAYLLMQYGALERMRLVLYCWEAPFQYDRSFLTIGAKRAISDTNGLRMPKQGELL